MTRDELLEAVLTDIADLLLLLATKGDQPSLIAALLRARRDLLPYRVRLTPISTPVAHVESPDEVRRTLIEP
jgi:hypothetical protein